MEREPELLNSLWFLYSGVMNTEISTWHNLLITSVNISLYHSVWVQKSLSARVGHVSCRVSDSACWFVHILILISHLLKRFALF